MFKRLSLVSENRLIYREAKETTPTTPNEGQGARSKSAEAVEKSSKALANEYVKNKKLHKKDDIIGELYGDTIKTPTRKSLKNQAENTGKMPTTDYEIMTARLEKLNINQKQMNETFAKLAYAFRNSGRHETFKQVGVSDKVINAYKNAINKMPDLKYTLKSLYFFGKEGDRNGVEKTVNKIVDFMSKDNSIANLLPDKAGLKKVVSKLSEQRKEISL